MAVIDGKHKVGDKVWVYEFYRLKGKEGHFHNIKPQQGLLIGLGGINKLEHDEGSERLHRIILYKTRKGKPTYELSSKELDLLKIRLADSYDEAVEEYNKLVQKEADFYRSKLEQVESYIVN